MSPEIVGILGFVVMFALIFLGMPIGLAMAFTAFAGMIFIGGFGQALSLSSIFPYSKVANAHFVILPLFLLMGGFVRVSALATDLYDVAARWLERMPGGLAIATITGCAGFAACTGSSIASVGLMTGTALPEMERHKYAPTISTGAIASGSTLGILIPPSGPMIVYALFAEVSIGKLFISGVFPGLILTGLFILAIYIMVKRKPSLAPSVTVRSTWRQKFRALGHVWAMALLVTIILGGLWTGIFTPVEAGGIGAFTAFVIALTKGRLTWQKFVGAIQDTLKGTAMIFVILLGAMMLNFFLALSGLPMMLANYVSGLPISGVAILIVILMSYFFLGCIMDTMAMTLLTLPIFIPIMKSLGIDLILFGLLQTITQEMALITPPIGMNVFILSGMARHIPMYDIFRGIVPFLLCIAVCIALLIAFPAIGLFLPETMIGS